MTDFIKSLEQMCDTFVRDFLVYHETIDCVLSWERAVATLVSKL